MNIDNFKYLKEALASDLVELLMKNYHLDLQKAIDTLYESETYSKLCNPDTGLYIQSTLYVYTFLQSELETGKVA